MSESVSCPTSVSVTTRKKRKKNACPAHSLIEIKCRQDSPEGTAVLPLFILFETEIIENNVLSLSVTPFPPLYEALRYKPLFKGVCHLEIYIIL